MLPNQKFEIAKELAHTLQRAGHIAYFAGGFVRDLLLKIPSEDIDIATSASVEEIQSIFPKTISVGAAFGVVMVIIEGMPFEVATFRQDLDYYDGRKPEGFIRSTPEEDAKRRDFTINGMFYDPLDEKIYDFVGGKEDLQRKIIRAIGKPMERFYEDRLRMLRAIRFSARLGFPIEEKTFEAICAFSHEIMPAVAWERISQELQRMYIDGSFKRAIPLLLQTGLWSALFPTYSKERVLHNLNRVANLPSLVPFIGAFLELFMPCSLDERISIAELLKCSNEEKKWLELLTKAEHITSKTEWAHFFADSRSESVLPLLSQRAENPGGFLHEKKLLREKLNFHIQKIQDKQPLVSSMDLKALGIHPGKEMGLLLKKAESIAIEKDLRTSKDVLQELF